MKQLAIIGAGQLGSRHLQGLAKLSQECEITVIDPMPASLEVARQRFDEMPKNESICSVRYETEIDALPTSLDYVIIATTADVRLGVLKALLARTTVKFMLLEKVLFQNIDEYAEADALLNAAGVRAWVNCPRRAFPLYAQVQEFFGTDPVHSLSAVGGNWGLGCNSIHFLDLFAMLTNELPSALSHADLDEKLIQSKRKNFMEFTGSLRGRFGNATFEVTSIADSASKLLVTIRSETRSCVIDESGGIAFFFDGKAWEQKSVTLPFLSELATTLATAILTDGDCALATFEQSQAYHLPLLRALGAHAHQWNGTPIDFCPVT
ncbi:Gfo/Idh/MocA family oxidoreductase [Janthinobacterium sp. PC23-8]|uniref:Gfo/Idh/MocA family oxidoreductase n=1 Tax=Janthinobacterium sp. PC23-8 TaxID=2012679 RepID=UPI000B975004|nr:Gfo/Idh/MocA family oxidoreductase [Janthinobacterium sp. PC23-8]OYO31196.1 hypothetical protein CD932_08725 [Janthinobacterium sp. PC23-8]